MGNGRYVYSTGHLQHGGSLEGPLGERALDAAPEGDGGEVDGESHLFHEIGPHGAQDVEDGGSHGVANVMELGRVGGLQDLLEEGGQVIQTGLVQPVWK